MNNSVLIFYSLILFSLGFPIDTQDIANTLYENIHTVNHESWDGLLKKYVDSDGNVNYAGILKESKTLDAYLQLLNENSPSDDWSKNEKLAFYINLYNAATVKLIIDNYPLKSIKDLSGPWDKKWIQIDGKKYSLGNIEHKILRKMNEPRIHFAINCASYSCPKLLNKAFLPETIEAQLEAVTIDFINDTSRNKISNKKIQLSNIFKWYKGDFTKNGSLIDYLNRYLNIKIDKKIKVSHLTYDWGLNESR